jgi:RecA-family ATPase
VVYRFVDFLQTEVKLEWLMQGLIPKAGSGILYGSAGIGKSTLSLRLGMSLATGQENFLKWPIVRPARVLFLSLEMAHDELKHFFGEMQLEEEALQQLQESFIIWPLGHAYPLDIPEYQREFLQYIDQYEIELVIIDSLAVAMYGSITSDDDVKRLNAFLNEDLRAARGCGYFFVHHPHKPNPERRGGFEDMFGSIYIANNTQIVTNLYQKKSVKSSNRLTVSVRKARLTLDKLEFDIFRKPDRSFELANGTIGDGPKASHERGKVTVPESRGRTLGIGRGLGKGPGS